MVIRLLLAILLLITMLVACGTAAPTAPGSETPTMMLTITPVASFDVAQPSSPSTIVGEITQLNGGILVEQQPGATISDKIVFSLNDATRIFTRIGDKLQPKTAGDLAIGQRVEVWAVDGIVAESFPGQATAETIIIADTAAEMTTTPNAAAPPDREPDVVGTITQASNTVWIDNNLVLLIAPTTQFFAGPAKLLKRSTHVTLRKGNVRRCGSTKYVMAARHKPMR